MSAWIAATAVERDAGRIAREQPELWREVRRFNLPVKLALAAAHRVVGSLAEPRRARLIGLAPCRPGSPELRQISRELDAGFARGSSSGLRVNPIYTLHAIDNLALSALAIRLENHEPCVCLGGAAGQAFAALEDAIDELAGGSAAEDVMIFGGDQSDASWRGEPSDAEACGVAIVVSTRPERVRLVGVERRSLELPSEAPIAHAAAGLARWLDALAAAPTGLHRYAVPARDGDGVDQVEIVAEVA
ncbi:MAG TPA: hypothetical protein VF469_32060 [Kofleriaceae bacterium]